MGTGSRRVLIVESRAHVPSGHFAVRGAQLAEAYVDLGYRVELLTSLGWAREHEHPSPPFAVRRWRPWAQRLRRRTEQPWVITLVEAIEIRARVRRAASPPELVVVLAWSEVPALLAALAPRRARWLVNHWGYPEGLPNSKLVDAVARWRERRRQARGGMVRIVVSHERLRQLWDERVPFLDPVVAPIVGAREIEPNPDARRVLGLPAGNLALLFGDSRLKRRDVVLDAFAGLDRWTLVVGGPMANDLAPRPGLATFPGAVDDAVRDQLFAAVDLVVLSFSADYPNESGTLMDAISAGTPVVCSDDARVAAIVLRHHLGPTFVGDDAESLATAVRHAPASLAPDALATAREEHSNRAVARGQLLVMGLRTPDA